MTFWSLKQLTRVRFPANAQSSTFTFNDKNDIIGKQYDSRTGRNQLHANDVFGHALTSFSGAVGGSRVNWSSTTCTTKLPQLGP